MSATSEPQCRRLARSRATSHTCRQPSRPSVINRQKLVPLSRRVQSSIVRLQRKKLCESVWRLTENAARARACGRLVKIGGGRRNSGFAFDILSLLRSPTSYVGAMGRLSNAAAFVGRHKAALLSLTLGAVGVIGFVRWYWSRRRDGREPRQPLQYTSRSRDATSRLSTRHRNSPSVSSQRALEQQLSAEAAVHQVADLLADMIGRLQKAADTQVRSPSTIIVLPIFSLSRHHDNRRLRERKWSV